MNFKFDLVMLIGLVLLAGMLQIAICKPALKPTTVVNESRDSDKRHLADSVLPSHIGGEIKNKIQVNNPHPLDNALFKSTNKSQPLDKKSIPKSNSAMPPPARIKERIVTTKPVVDKVILKVTPTPRVVNKLVNNDKQPLKQENNRKIFDSKANDVDEQNNEEDGIPDEDHILKFVKIPDGVGKLPVEKLRPVDHMDAVRMEQDGHVNKDFHKEMFIGNHEEFENDRYEEAESKLKDIVSKVDTDHDGQLSVVELERWVMQKMEEHFAEAAKENEEIFKHLDPDGNGKVHWKDYYVHFLLAKGYDRPLAERHVVDYDQITLDPDSKEELIRYKFRWSDADTEPVDNELTRDEFMAFRHPEQSEKTLNNMVISIMSGIDSDGDGTISEDEFTALPPGEVEGEEFQTMDKNWQKERQEEFRKAMDLNHDGKVTRDELKKYLDPRNPVQALMEAKNLLSFIDDNHDDSLSLEEIIRHKDIFITSKVMNFAANVHDEF